MMHPVKLLAVAAILLAATAAAEPVQTGARPPVRTPFPAVLDFRTVQITLRRGPCFGSCPSYRVEIDGDGTVRYLGENFVAVQGARTSRVRVAKVRALVRAFARADFFWTFDSYRAPITDLPTYTLTISFDGHHKEVVDYDGQMRGMPNDITDLESAVDQAAGTARWIKS